MGDTKEEKVNNKRVLARRAVSVGDYASAREAYAYILDKEPDDVEAMFYVPYCNILRKARNGFVADCTVFRNNLRIVVDTLRESDMEGDGKAELCKEIVEGTQGFCNEMLSRINASIDKLPDDDSDRFWDLESCRNNVYGVMASACVFVANGGGIDLNPCKYTILEMLDDSLSHYGWFTDNNVCNTLRLVRTSLMDKMRSMGDDLSKEDELDRKYGEMEHDRVVERKVIAKLESFLDGVKGVMP